MWLNELDSLKDQYIEYKEERTRLMNGVYKKKVTKSTVKRVVKKQELVVEDD
jgi:hypothetical protein